MSQQHHGSGPEGEMPVAAELDLPAAVRAAANGQLDGQTILGWAEYDLDESNRYAQRFAVLTEARLVLLYDGRFTILPVADIGQTKIIEDVGLDRLVVYVQDEPAAELRYTRRCRRDVTRLHRKLQRLIARRDPQAEAPPAWLEAVERRAEQLDRCPKCGQMIPSYAEGVCPQCLQKRRILWRLLDVARPYRRTIWLALALTLLQSSLSTVPPIFQRKMVNTAIDVATAVGGIPQRTARLLFWAAAIFLAVIVLEAVGAVRIRRLAMLGTWVARDLRHQVYAHLHDLSLRYFGKRRTGSLITRVTNDTDRLWDFIVFGSVSMIRDLLMIVVTAGVMFWMNWRLALVALVPLPPLALVTYLRSMKMQYLFGRLWTYWARMTAVVGDALPGVRVVKAFGSERREVERFDRRSDDYTLKEQDVNRVWTGLQPVISATMRLGGLLVWTVGGYLLIRHPSDANSFGTLVAFSSFLHLFYQPIMELASSNRMITRAASSAQRVFEVLDTPPEIYSRSNAITKPSLEGRVEFRQVSFSYEGAQPALREVSLVVEPGQMIGLCGPSGAGKSTFVNLICRFYDVTDGQILIDGVDVRDYDVQWLRRQIGVVLQEPYLFHGTIAENIRYGNPEATTAQIIAAARAANAHDFIVGFADGYDTIVGERGQSLSGGERQRISIARAILHNPRILILDEATSSVDTETERQIQEALDRLVTGRTTFAIAHRLSTLQAADRLVVLEKGRIVETGTHAELVGKEDGVYARLHKRQAQMSSLVAIAE